MSGTLGGPGGVTTTMWCCEGAAFRATRMSRRPREASKIRGTVQIDKLPFGVVHWSLVAPLTCPGATGSAEIREYVTGRGQKLRMLRLSPQYSDAEACAKGHFVHMLAGELEVDLDDGRRVALRQGDSFFLGDGVAHRMVSNDGATVFVVE